MFGERGGDVKIWLNLQVAYDIKIAEAARKSEIENEIAPLAVAA